MKPIAIAVVVAALAGAVWWNFSPKGPQTPPSAQARPVLLEQVQSRAMPVELSAIGNVEALAIVPVRPRVEGEVLEVHFKEGDDVEEGQPLFTVDYRSAEATKRQAEAQLARDRAQLERAKRDLDRYSQLLRSGNTTKQRVEQALSDVRVYEAAVRADLAAIDNARLALDYAKIKAPVAGRTGAIRAKAGSLAKPSDLEAMVSITQTKPILVAFKIAEHHLPLIRKHYGKAPLQAIVTSTLQPELHETGELSFIDSSIDQNSGTILLKATFANANDRLWPGQYVSVRLIATIEQDALVISKVAVQTGQNGDYVYVVDNDNKAQIQPIKVDRTIGEEAIITSGLNLGQKIVTEGQMRLVPGMMIRDSSAVKAQ